MTFTPTRAAGLERLSAFLPKAGKTYENTRNYDDPPSDDGLRANVSQLSPWLHAGLLSEAEVVDTVLSQHSPKAAEKFIAEVFWRIYFKGYLEQRPSIWASYCEDRDKALDRAEANSGLRTAYAEATEGRTGIAAFDHWARELVATGYLHNHARMWFASIWIFTLKLDWQLGADFFLRHLADGDAASNTLSWRWVGGLHTKGKTYLARPENIARYTANHPGGPLAAEGLATDAPPLEEAPEHGRQPISWPDDIPSDFWEKPFALILHDDASHHVPLALPARPALVIEAARPDARSPLQTGAIARDFAAQAVSRGAAEAGTAFDCPVAAWDGAGSLQNILDTAGIQHAVMGHLPAGWTRDSLMGDLAAAFDEGRAYALVSDLSRATWPFAKAGFFGVKKKVDGILGELAITGSDIPAA